MNHDTVLGITRQIIDKFELLEQKFYVINDNEKIYVKDKKKRRLKLIDRWLENITFAKLFWSRYFTISLMKLKSKISNLTYSGLLIQPKLTYCRRVKSFSNWKSNNQISWNTGVVFNFSWLNWRR
jgi:hypothetical protein